MDVIALCLLAAAVAAAEPEAVILEFTAPDRCPPCQQIAPLVHRLQREGYPLRIVNADENEIVCLQYRIFSIPTFVLTISGREISRIEGKPSENDLRRMCERARLANASAAADAAAAKKSEERSQPQEALEKPTAKQENQAPKFVPTKPKPEAEGPKSAEPIIRAKNDDSGNLPKTTSTDLLHVCPRIRVKDALGVNFGTGTIIDSREGRTTILTCGHLFRKLDDQSVIEVDVFNGPKHETFVGRVLRYDLEADVGLLWIPTARRLPAAAVASLSEASIVDQHVFSVGCSSGDPPTKLQHRVTCLNRYNGPDNIECSGVPVQGRSGGGLFNTSGRLVGVCIAADQRDQRGLYSGLQPIHALLDEMKLSHLHPHDGTPQKVAPVEVSERASLASQSDRTSSSKSRPKTIEEEPMFDGDEAAAEDQSGPFASSKASSEIDDASTSPKLAAASLGIPVTPAMSASDSVGSVNPQNESEVVCIIRPLNNPRAASRVVIINRASTKFLQQLSGELDQQAKPTSAVVREAKYVAPASNSAAPRAYRRNRAALAP